MARSPAAVTVSSLVVVALLAAGGCASDYSESAAASIRRNPSPNMDTLYQRPVDIDNALAVMWDTNWRMFNEDLGRAMYLDKPSMMTPEPMPR